MPRKIEISHKTIIFTVLFLVSLWFLYFIRDIIFLFFISLLLMAIINPFVTKLSRFKIPRGVSILVAYILSIGIFVFLIYSLFPVVIDQTTKLISLFPSFIENIGLVPVLGDSLISQIASHVGNFSESLVKFTFSAFSNVLSLITVLVMTFYLLLGREKIEQGVDGAFGKEIKRKVKLFLDLWERELGGWIKGQLLLMLFVGVLTFIALIALRIPFALPLALLAGLFEIIPIIGPLFSAIPAVIIGFNISPLFGFLIIALYFLVQQIENHLLVPKIMEKSTGINPVLVILSLSIGSKVAGFLGVLLAIPVFLTLKIALRVFLAR